MSTPLRRATLLMVAILLAAPSARAQSQSPKEAKARARAAVAAADAAFRRRQFSAAAEGYLDAHRTLESAGVAAQPALIYNAGLAYEQLGACDRVVELFERFLKTQRGNAPADLVARLEEARRCAPEVAIQSTPANATVRIDGQLAGHTPLQVNLKTGAHTLSVTLEGYKPQERAFAVERGRPLAFTLALESVVGRGRIALDVGRPARISLDGEVVATGPYRGVRDVPAGIHRLRFEQEGCRPVDLTVDVPHGAEAFAVSAPGCEALALERGRADQGRSERGASMPAGGRDAIVLDLPPAPPPTAALEAPPSSGPGAATWIAGGVGVAGLIGGAVFLGLHFDAVSRRDAADADSTITSSGPIVELDQEAFRWSIASSASFALGAVGVGVALVALLAGDDEPSATAISATATPRGVEVRW